MKYELSPSILSADFANLERQFRTLKLREVKSLHIDVMDGVFVPNISMGLTIVSSIRGCTSLFFDTHLMIVDPIRYAERFALSGSDGITFHLEAAEDPQAVIDVIRKCGKRVGLAISPATPVSSVEPYLDKIDMLLIMTVEPGFGGQAYIDSCTDKIRAAREMIDRRGLNVDIQVDGGIRADNVDVVLDAGANNIVAGSAVFKGDIASNIRMFQKAFARYEG